jgi:uncharacterized protein YcbK (DUF882 family)
MTEPSIPPSPRKHLWGASGLTSDQELVFEGLAACVILLFVAGWIVAVIELHRQIVEENAVIKTATKSNAPAATVPPPPTPSQGMTEAILNPSAPSTAFLNDAALEFLSPLHGYSGKVTAVFRKPGEAISTQAPDQTSAELSGQAGTVNSPDFAAPPDPGIYKLSVQLNQATRAIDDLHVVTLVPFAQKRGGKIGLYYLGSWPYEKGGTPRSAAYANPNGFIEVTRENADTMVSAHFRLRDFLTKDQPNVWPKYLLLNPKLLDKLELVIGELEAMGHPVRHMQVMSGFRTPQYNHGGGNTAGRANLSRHMYGDASDVFVDNDRNGTSDDLNGDGRINEKDAEVVLAAAERVERKYPALVGGVGVYVACCGHGPFTHIDVRGYRARWRGTGSG